MSLSNYIQRLALVLRKSIKHQQGKVIRAKEITTITAAFVQQDHILREVSRWFTYLLMEHLVVLTRSRRVTAALIAKYVNRASSLFTGAHAFHIRLSYRNSYSVAIFCIIFDIIL